jgi:hypothetical protein
MKIKKFNESIDNEWIEIVEDNIKTYPNEGISVIISDGKHYDIAYYLMSGEYVWMKEFVSKDTTEEYKEFVPIKWKYFLKTN